MKRIVHTTTPNQPPAAPKALEIDPKDISVQRLIDDSLLALYREVKNLLMLTTHGKLLANDAKDLRDHLKLLFELKDREKDRLDGLTDEELEILAKAAMEKNEPKQV